MTKKTALFLFLTLFVIFDIFFFAWLFLRPKTSPTPPTATNTIPVEPTLPPAIAETTLAFSPQSYTLSSASGSIDVLIDTGTNNATAVQLELSYDPKMLTNVAITPGAFFQNPIELLKKIDKATGKITYAFGTSLTGKAQSGKGTIATLTFTTNLQKGQSTTVTFLPQTLVTAEKAEKSVLKTTTNATITR